MMPIHTCVSLTNASEFNAFIQKHPICLVYFSTPGCSVCDVLKPKLFELLSERFAALAMGEVDCVQSPALAAQQSIFAVPTVLVYVEGQENLRRTRSFSPVALAEALLRPYSILMGDG